MVSLFNGLKSPHGISVIQNTGKELRPDKTVDLETVVEDKE